MGTAFQLIGGHPALDLVNTLDNRFGAARVLELLESYQDVLRFMRQSRLLSKRNLSALEGRAETKPATRILERVHELRETFAVLCYGGSSDDRSSLDALKRLSQWAIEAGSHRRLIFGHSEKRARRPTSWTWNPADLQQLELPLWILSTSAAALLSSDDWRRVSYCNNDACRWLFLDTSKNHLRRWCDMAVCGNRMKARRFHARQA